MMCAQRKHQAFFICTPFATSAKRHYAPLIETSITSHCKTVSLME